MLKNLIKSFFKKEPDKVSVNIERYEQLLMVRLYVNDRSRAKIQCVIESEDTILIGDIQHSKENTDYNKGYGSRMMKALLDYAKEQHFSILCGNLSVVDLDHKERLHHFYKKFGFDIIEYPELRGNYYGKIELCLSKLKPFEVNI